MTEDDDNRTDQAFRKGIELARLDRQVKREAQAKRLPTFSGRTFDKDPEDVTDAAVLRALRSERQRNGDTQDSTTATLRHRLLQYPNIDNTNVDEFLFLYEDRSQTKHGLRDRGYSNAMAEAHLDRQGYPRPPGWHSVFFYPDSNRPRNTTLFWLAVMIALGWLFLPSG